MYLVTHWKDKFSIFEQIQTTMAMHDDLLIILSPYHVIFDEIYAFFMQSLLLAGRCLDEEGDDWKTELWVRWRKRVDGASRGFLFLQFCHLLSHLSCYNDNLSLAVTFVMSSWQLTTRCALRRSGWRSLDGRTLKIRETVFQSRSFIIIMIVLVYIINRMKKIVTIHHCERKRRI